MKIESGSLFKFNGLTDKEARNLAILELIRNKKIVSRTEISKITGINIVSISGYIKHFIENKLVMDAGLDESTGGRKPELVELNTKENYAVGIEICEQAIRGVMMDLGFNIIKSSKKALKSPGSGSIGSEIKEFIKDLFASSGASLGNLGGVAISSADPAVYAEVKNIEKEIGVKIYFADPAHCAAAGEKYFNKEIRDDDLLYIYSSLGDSMIMKKNEFFGENFSEEAKCLRPWGESFSIENLARQEIEKGVGTVIVDMVKADVSKITKGTITEAAKQNDEVALGLLQSVSANLSIRIAYLVNTFNLRSVVIGGGPENGTGFILANIKKTVKKLVLKKFSDTVKMIPGVLGENAVSVGASALMIRQMFLLV